jgi:MFS family permease
MTTAEPAGASRYAAFGHRAFARYWLARFAATFAVQIVTVSVGWQIYDLTRNPFDLGLVGLIEFLPSLALVLVTGAAVDRFGRRTIMGLSALVEAGCAVALLVMTMTGSISAIGVFSVIAVFGVARAFFGPASSALLPNVVPTPLFANAVAWNSSAWQLASIVGPAVGGLLYGVSPVAAYGTAMLMMAVSAALIYTVQENGGAGHKRASFSDILGGFSYIWKEKVVLGAISLDLFAVLLGGAVALLPVYARDILVVGPVGLGMLRAAPGIGAIAMALLLTGAPIRDHAGRIMFICVGLFGLFTAVFGFSTLAWLSILMLAAAGAADMVSVFVRETLIQTWTPDRLRGRVNAVNMVFVGASNELGSFRAGAMAALVGAVPAVVFGGLASIAVAGLWAWLFPQLLNARRLDGRT